MRAGLRNPVIIAVREKGKSEVSRTPAQLENFYAILEPRDKLNHLVQFLSTHSQEKVLLFCSTCAVVDYLGVLLTSLLPSTSIHPIHGKMKKKRHKIFERFKSTGAGVLLCTDVMARGVDIPEVKWVVQYDPPSNAESFVHRCGRTARIGNQGSALLLLYPSEETYVDFLKINQQVELSRMSLPPPPYEYLDKVRALNKTDRAVFDKSNRAFVSYIQSYSKHECNMLLKIKELDLGGVAESYGLLRMPRMPELKHHHVTNFKPDPIDVNTIKYADKGRETERQGKMAEYASTGKWPGLEKKKLKKPPSSVPWSNKVEQKEKRRDKKAAKAAKRKAKTEQTTKEDGGDDDFAEEYRLMKRIRSGKARSEDFDAAIQLDNMSDDEDA